MVGYSVPESPSSTSSGRSKLFLSLDNTSNFSTPTSSRGSQDRHWSDVVPPKSALTFAAMWDPDDGMVTFSGARLLDSRGEHQRREASPDPFDEDYSQVVPVNEDAETFGENSATMATFQDAFKAFLHRVPRNSKQFSQHKHSNTLASSTLGGLDVYLRDPAVPMKRKTPHHYSCFDRLDVEPSFKAGSTFGRVPNESRRVVDEGYCEDRVTAYEPANLKSRFSTTTTSTSNYIEVARFDKGYESEDPTFHKVDTLRSGASPVTPPSSPRRRLKKRRPDVLSSPISPLSGSSTASCDSPLGTSPPTSPSGSEKSKCTNVVRRMGRGSSDEDWVCIEITPTITQRLVPDLNTP
ncbi:hypothetical protein BV22DRAFT_464685 [Leucogyrophana mollusca]|uniref:Uncharacterized protein n=1 Tax=Leucogyrophana mollusca TaxID=85980 RepID=A0ACB8BH27_9AGAM|nr:hypothetical protein BV22DRAFT_464685 [Leucogyrophana mollusca]